MNRSLNFFFWTVWSSEALAAVASASTPDEVRTAWRGRGGGYDPCRRKTPQKKSTGGRRPGRRSVERLAHAPSWAGRPAKVRKHRVSGREEVPEGGGTPSDPPTRGTRVGAWRGVDPPACAAGRLPPRMSGAVRPSRCPTEFPRGRRTRSRCRRTRSLGTQPAYTRRRIEFVPSCSADATCLPSPHPA